jgi:hypothetical protein
MRRVRDLGVQLAAESAEAQRQRALAVHAQARADALAAHLQAAEAKLIRLQETRLLALLPSSDPPSPRPFSRGPAVTDVRKDPPSLTY